MFLLINCFKFCMIMLCHIIVLLQVIIIMEDFYLSFLDSQINSSLVSEFSSFINDICEEDYISNFRTDEIFSTHTDLIKCVCFLSWFCCYYSKM